MHQVLYTSALQECGYLTVPHERFSGIIMDFHPGTDDKPANDHYAGITTVAQAAAKVGIAYSIMMDTNDDEDVNRSLPCTVD